MKSFTVLVSLFVSIRAYPDVSHLPSGSYLPTSGHVGSGSSSYGSGIGGFQSQSSFVSGSQSTFGGSGGSFQGGIGGSGQFGIGGGFHGGAGGFHGGAGGFQDQKHVYFFAAPEEHSNSRLRINIIPNSQRNTKIIFVKAPSYGSVTPEVNAPQSLSEDKTLVYVLVKRPEHGGQINIPAGTGIKPSKPEVYFIKYKSQQDAQQLIAGGLQGQQVGSNVPDIGNEANFVRTLESASSGSHGIGSIGSGSSSIGSGVSIGTHGSGSGSSIYTSGSTGGTFGPAGASGPY